MRLIPLVLATFIAIANAVPQAPAITSTTAASAQPTSVQSPAASATQPPAASGSVSASVSASGSQQPIATGILPGNSTVNGTQSAVASNGGAANNTLAGLPTSASYGNSVYPGAASFVTPTASKSVSPLYRIDPKENVTFIWSFTDLLVQPANLTLAAVAPNKVTYTITAMPGLATSAVWQIKDVPTASPLMMGMYQVQLYDQRGVSAPAQPGWLAPYTRLSIAFYSPESYSAMTGSDYCPTCFYNAGRRIAESFGPIAVALSVASATSAMILYGLLY
ncbi:unnamed protein product [Mucor circinelloides]|uniref:DUF7137 domain-containing protein n=1 Tax=Mucor circinelloides f. circinelloides (strain 1006PhL) TaxID=1220926 RepID=S2K8F4_MUCC1|nr:hypothetical protein HMPREF1544_04653 [Mucor circinelloides 1006PhL]KAG1095967.1 hypothetical protein G6F42_018458 [Rhizopus arrhizus]